MTVLEQNKIETGQNNINEVDEILPQLLMLALRLNKSKLEIQKSIRQVEQLIACADCEFREDCKRHSCLLKDAREHINLNK